jgi:predicted Zn-dependent peptidase
MIHKSVLDNGIQVITEHIPGVHSVSIGFWIQSGSRHEPASRNGISHFLEHMLFKGTYGRSAREIALEIDSVGGVLNGFTNRELICFYAKVMSGKLPLALDLLTDLLLNSRLDETIFDNEKKVVQRELAMVEDSPDDHVHDLFCELVWKDHPLGQPVAGTSKSILSISRDHLLEYLAANFCGSNLIVAAAGDLEHEPLRQAVESRLARLPTGSSTDRQVRPKEQRRFRIEHRNSDQVHLCLGTRALSQKDPRRFAGYLLNGILGGGMSSRLFQSIRAERGMAYSVYSYLSTHSDAGCQVVYLATAPEDTPEAIRLILSEFRRLKRESVSAAELLGAREQLKGSLLLSLENTDNRMTRLAKNQIFLGDQVRVEETLAAFDAVKAEDIQALASLLFVDTSLNLQLLGRVEDCGFSMMDLTLN